MSGFLTRIYEVIKKDAKNISGRGGGVEKMFRNIILFIYRLGNLFFVPDV